MLFLKALSFILFEKDEIVAITFQVRRQWRPDVRKRALDEYLDKCFKQVREEDEKNNLTRNNGKFVKGNKEGHRFKEGERTPEEKEAIKEGIAKAKSIREWKAAIREKVFQEFMSRDIEKFSAKEINQALRTVWNDEIKEAEEHQAPVINYIENVNKDKI